MTSYFIGDYNLSDDSKTSFYIVEEENYEHESSRDNDNYTEKSKSSKDKGKDKDKNKSSTDKHKNKSSTDTDKGKDNYKNKSSTDTDTDKENIFIFNIEISKHESLSSVTQTFIYLNRYLISNCVRKKPNNFKHLINNPLISKYLN